MSAARTGRTRPGRWLVLSIAPLLSGCVGWVSATPRGLERELRVWEPAAVTTRSVAFGLATNLPAWSFTEHAEVAGLYGPLVHSLFPEATPVAPAVASMFGPSDWPGDHDYAVRVQFHWNGCAAVSSARRSYGVDATAAAAGAAEMGQAGDSVMRLGAGMVLPEPGYGRGGEYMAAGVLGWTALSLAGGLGLAFAFTGIGLALNIVLPHYYQLPVTATIDVFDRRRRSLHRLVVGVIGNLFVWPPLAFLPIHADAPWEPAIDTVARWSMLELARHPLWQLPEPAPVVDDVPQPEAPVQALPYRREDRLAGAPERRYRFRLQSGQTVRFDLTFRPHRGDLDLELLDAAGQPLAHSQTTEGFERITFRAAETCTVTLRVHGRGRPGPYTLYAH